jgi:hypothetical protein
MADRRKGEWRRTPPLTPALVQVRLFPPAAPDTASVPVHDAPVAIVVPRNENVPENDDAVTVPFTLPLFDTVPVDVCHVPVTAEPLCASVNDTS